MSPTRYENPIRRLNSITDEEAAATVSPQTLAELAAAVMEIPASAHRRKRQCARLRWRRPAFSLALAAGTAVAVLAAIELASGHGPTVAQPADAAILRGAEAALRPPAGSIVIDSFTMVTTCSDSACRRAMQAAHDARVVRWSGVTENVSGGLGNELTLEESDVARPGVEMAEVAGGHELYDPQNNTIYTFSYFGRDITVGPTAGMYLYHLPTGPTLFWSLPYLQDAVSAPPLAITAQQARDLRDGTARIEVTQAAGGQHRLRVAPALAPVPFWSPAAQARAFLGPLKVVGPTVVGSREAIKLVPLHGQGEYDVAPGSYYPIREIRVAHGASTTTTWDQYRVLPETGSNRSLLSLTARHPSARINGSNADYLTAWKRLTLGN